MSADSTQHELESGIAEARADIPPGTPVWITAKLIALTQKVWQPYYAKPLSSEDAVTIVRNVGKLFGVLSRE